MYNPRSKWQLGGLILTLWIILPAGLRAAVSPVVDFQRLAKASEDRREWLQACWWYDEILRLDKTNREGREGYRRCLRRFHLNQRHDNLAYREAVSQLSPAQALDIYDQVLEILSIAYVDRAKASLDQLLASGLEELRYALREPLFTEQHLRNVSQTALRALTRRLEGVKSASIRNREDAREQLIKTLQTVYQQGIPSSPNLTVAIVLEFACGACNSLDEYSLFLTPGYQNAWKAQLGNGSVGIGMEVVRLDDKFIVSRVYPKSPAQELGILPQDQVLRIDQHALETLPSEMVIEKLRGKNGSVVELEVLTPGNSTPHVLRLTRRPVRVPSVEHEVITSPMEQEIIGLLRINQFRSSTVQEVKEALAILQTQGTQAIVLDLRGNPGGAFEAALEVAELFLEDGVIAYTQSPLRRYNRPHRSSSMHPLRLPLVVLIDAQTASAAEVVAGALKDNARAHLIGETTFGKGTIQRTVPLDRPPLERIPAGVRLTVANIFSPTNQPYNGQGITPHEILPTEGDGIVATAKLYLQGVLQMAMVP